MKILIWILIFLLPLHAFLITTLKCKYRINTDFLRFWKELILIFLVIYSFFFAYKNSHYSLKKLYHKNTLLWLITAFIISSAIYIFFPFFTLKAASVLGFRYDVFFLIALLVGLYTQWSQENLRFYLKTLFLSTFGILIIFLPWYLFWDISSLSNMFWYSNEVSTYTANQCISFAQNVNGEHRFQATFGGPIRFSVFLSIVGSLFTGYILSATRFSKKQKYILLGAFGILIFPAIFFSYSKTSMLGALFAIIIFSFLSYKYIYRKKITRKFYSILGLFSIVPLLIISLFKWDLFLHLGAIVNRLENISKSIEMFFYNPIGYGLGIAGPASQIGNSIESAGNWVIATNTTQVVHRFLPENWYIQILLEQGIIGLSLFLALIILIWVRLISRLKRHRDFLDVGITSAYFSLCFMALFTHAFEEAATSYTLFLFIGIILAGSIRREQVSKK